MDELMNILKNIMSVENFSNIGSEAPFSGVVPFKVQMKLKIPNLQGKVDADAPYIQIRQLESYFIANDLIDGDKVTIATLKMSTIVHYWQDNLNE